MAVQLRPTGKVTLGTSAKFFSKGNPLGSSTGSEELVEFEILWDVAPLEERDGRPFQEESHPDPKELARAILTTRREMDERVLIAEYLRGSLNGTELESRRKVLKIRYAKALGDEPSCEEEL